MVATSPLLEVPYDPLDTLDVDRDGGVAYCRPVCQAGWPMTATLYRPDVESWRRRDQDRDRLREDALAEFERQRSAHAAAARRLQLVASLVCFASVALILLAAAR